MTANSDTSYHGKNPIRRLRAAWREDLGDDERSAILAWASFTTTFSATRALTHWIKDGHGPKGGGMSVGGQHFHHYNLGIATLSALSRVTLIVAAPTEVTLRLSSAVGCFWPLRSARIAAPSMTRTPPR